VTASATDPGEVTRLLASLTDGERHAGDRLLELVYAQLRGIAGKQMAAERPGHTLGATALAHEAYLKLVGQEQTDWRSRAHFMRPSSPRISCTVAFSSHWYSQS